MWESSFLDERRQKRNVCLLQGASKDEHSFGRDGAICIVTDANCKLLAWKFIGDQVACFEQAGLSKTTPAILTVQFSRVERLHARGPNDWIGYATRDYRYALSDTGIEFIDRTESFEP